MTRLLPVALLPAMLYAQQAAPDEVRVSSRPYVAPPPLSVRVESRLVELSVAVRDGSGRTVRGLQRENFQILDEGKERAIASFAEEDGAGSAPPAIAASGDAAPARPAVAAAAPQSRFVALFIDDVNAKDYAAAGDLGRTQAAARRFVTEALKPGVRIGIFTASGTVTQDFSSDPAILTDAIGHIKAHQRMSEIGLQYCPRVTPYRAYQIAQLHDYRVVRLVVSETGPAPDGYNCAADSQQVVVEAEETWRRVKEIATDTLAAVDRVVAYLGSRPGARTLVVASSGFLAQTLEDKQQVVIDHAVRIGVVISSLDSKGMYSEAAPGCRPTDPNPGECTPHGFNYETMALADRLMMANAAMADLAYGTGGEFFHNNNDLHAGLVRLGVAPEVTYRLSFSPTGVPSDGAYRKLKVKLVHASNYTAETRPGYFAPSDKPVVEDPRVKLDRAVASAETMSDVPAGLAVQLAKAADGRKTVRVVVRIDVAKLAFGAQDGRKTQRITFVSALRDTQGNIVAAKEGAMDLALTPETYDRLVKSGLNAELSLEAAPGTYSLREVVQESMKGSLSASTNAVDLR